MSSSFLRRLTILVCILSLTLHFSAESAGMLDSASVHAEQAHGPETHGEEDHFVPVLTQEEYSSNFKDCAVPFALGGGFSRSIVPQLPPPKPI